MLQWRENWEAPTMSHIVSWKSRWNDCVDSRWVVADSISQGKIDKQKCYEIENQSQFYYLIHCKARHVLPTQWWEAAQPFTHLELLFDFFFVWKVLIQDLIHDAHIIFFIFFAMASNSMFMAHAARARVWWGVYSSKIRWLPVPQSPSQCWWITRTNLSHRPGQSWWNNLTSCFWWAE